LKRLEIARLDRHLPRDEKQITSWNALALLAIIEAIKIDSKYQKTGLEIARFLNQQWDGARLSRSMLNLRKFGHGTLEDYAYTSLALTLWSQIQNDENIRQTNKKILQQAWKIFFKPQGWQMDSAPVTPYISTVAMTTDGPLPSPSAILIVATLKQSQTTDATTAMGVGHELLKTAPFWYASQLSTLAMTLE
jgi:uncharacterized protein YyaL (SSP411 family)